MDAFLADPQSPTAALVLAFAVLLLAIAVNVYVLAQVMNPSKRPASPPAVVSPWQQPGFGWVPQPMGMMTPPPMQSNTGVEISDMRRELDKLSGDETFVGEVPTMEMMAKKREELSEVVRNQTPQEILAELKAGNARFWTGRARRPELSAMERRAMILMQAPKVAVIGCADSRVPIEIVFDQGLGDIFAIRVAGNVYGDTVAASLEYAVFHLQVKLVVVMGHEGCGAVKSARLPNETLNTMSPALQNMLKGMKGALSDSSDTFGGICDNRARDRYSVVLNTKAQLDNLLTSNKQLRAKHESGEIMVTGAFYEISSGLVDFFDPAPGTPNSPRKHF